MSPDSPQSTDDWNSSTQSLVELDMPIDEQLTPKINVVFSPDGGSRTPIFDDTYIDQAENHMDENISVDMILREIGLEKYIGKFEMEEVELLTFSMLNYDDLVELDVDEGDRETILYAVGWFSGKRSENNSFNNNSN